MWNWNKVYITYYYSITALQMWWGNIINRRHQQRPSSGHVLIHKQSTMGIYKPVSLRINKMQWNVCTWLSTIKWYVCARETPNRDMFVNSWGLIITYTCLWLQKATPILSASILLYYWCRKKNVPFRSNSPSTSLFSCQVTCLSFYFNM